MRVPVYDRQASLAPLQGGQVNPVIPAGDNGAAMAGMTNQFMLRLKKMNDDFEDAHTLELLNKLKQDSTDYHENPEKGIYNTQLGYKAQGTYQDADRWLRERGEHYAMQIKGERAKANFRRMAGEYIQQRGVQNSKFEAEQMKKYEAEQSKSTIQNGLNDIALHPYDEEYINNTKQHMVDALELLTRYSSPETRRLELAEMEDSIATARFSAMFSDNPAKANEWYEQNVDSFSAENKEKFRKALESYKIQSEVDRLMEEYPQEYEEEAIKNIREQYSGDYEERLVAAYRARVNEQEIQKNNQERALRKAQSDLRERIEKAFYMNGIIPSSEQLRQYVENNQLTPQDAERIETLQATGARRSRIEQRIRARNPDMTRNELDIAVMRQMGTTNEEHEEAFAICLDEMLYGGKDTKLLQYYYQSGKITAEEVNRIVKHAKKFDTAQANFLRGQRSILRKYANALIKSFHFTQDTIDELETEFNNRVLDLDNKDKNFEENVNKLVNELLLREIDESGQRTEGIVFGLSRLGEFSEQINYRKFQSLNFSNDIFPSNIDLETQSGMDLTQIPALNMIEGGTTTGRFYDYRKYRKSQHNGLDIAAPEGTPIKLSDFGIPLEVTEVNTATPSKGGGNYVTLSGTYENGDKIDITVSHMQNNSITVAEGDIVEVGTIIGKVGNTGMTSDRSKRGKVTAWYEGKSSGFHMDLKIKIQRKGENESKYVDPETFTPPRKKNTKQSQKAEQSPEVKSIQDFFLWLISSQNRGE